MSLDRLSKADIKTIMQLNEITAYSAWNHGHKAGDEGAAKDKNPYTPGNAASLRLLELLTKALNA